MLYLLAISILLVSAIPRTKTQEIYYVAPDEEDCPVNTICHDVEYYIDNVSSLAPLKDVVFNFMPGTHAFQGVFVIEDAVNVTLQGIGEVQYSSSSASWQSNVTFQFGGLYNGLRITSSQYVTINGIRMIMQGLNSEFVIGESADVVIANTHVEHGIGLLVRDCANVSISNSSFLHASAYGLLIQFDQLLNMDNNSVTVHHTNFSYNGLAGLAIIGNAEDYFPVTIELSNLLLTDNIIYGMAISMLHCIGTIAIEGIGSIGSKTGFFFKNTLPCTATKPNICVTNSVFEGASRYGIKMLIASNSGMVSFWSVTVRDIVGVQATGIAIAQRPHQLSYTNPNTFLLRNMTVERIHPINHSLATSQHAMSLSLIPIITIVDVVIQNNVGNGLSLLNTQAALSGNITFYNNSAVEGGAIKLRSSSLLANQYLKVFFTSNRAESYGGAIFVTTYHNKNDCLFANSFFENVTLVFENNTADQAGSVIYGDLDDCFSKQGFEASFLIDGQSGIGTALDCKHSIVSSNEYQLYFCGENCLSSNTYELEAIPGKSFTFEIIVVGEYNGTTPASVKLDSDDFNSSVILNVPSGSRCVEETLTLNLAKPTTLVNFSISVSDPTLIDYRVNPAWLAIHVLPCPVGFELANDHCNCAKVLTDLDVECDITSTTLDKPEDTWVGPSEANECIYFAQSCSLDYCNESNTNFSTSDPDSQCMSNRHGILCGSCTAEYSLLLGSNRCENCTSEESAWRIPVVILGSAIAGIGLVALLVGLNLTVSVGTINGLIFFANIVKLYEASFAQSQNTIIGVLISWLNMDMGIETCFYQGMDACGKIGLQFMFPSYVIALALFFIILGNADQWKIVQVARLSGIISPVSKSITSLLGNRAVPVLATLFLLSYNKLLRTVILIFSKADIQCCNSAAGLCSHSFTAWYIDGNIQYLTSCHLILFIVASLVSVLIVLFTTFLILFPLVAESRLQACECRGKWRLKFQPWFDAFGGPYKERYRFWVGLLILVRCMIALVVALAPSTSAKLTTLAWTSIVLIMVSVILQVYKHWILNVMEVWYFAGLLILAYFGETNSTSNTVGTYTIISASMLVGLCLMLYSVHIHLKSLGKRYATCQKRIKWYTSCQEKIKVYTSKSVHHFETKEATTSVDETEMPDVSVTCTTVSIDDNDYREPQVAEDFM